MGYQSSSRSSNFRPIHYQQIDYQSTFSGSQTSLNTSSGNTTSRNTLPTVLVEAKTTQLQKPQVGCEEAADTVNRKRRMISHPELLRILMNSEVNTMPTSLTNLRPVSSSAGLAPSPSMLTPAVGSRPVHASIAPRGSMAPRSPRAVNNAGANGTYGMADNLEFTCAVRKSGQAQDASTPVMQKPVKPLAVKKWELDDDMRLAAGWTGAGLAFVVLFLLAVRCFAAEGTSSKSASSEVRKVDMQTVNMPTPTSAHAPTLEAIPDLAEVAKRADTQPTENKTIEQIEQAAVVLSSLPPLVTFAPAVPRKGALNKAASMTTPSLRGPSHRIRLSTAPQLLGPQLREKPENKDAAVAANKVPPTQAMAMKQSFDTLRTCFWRAEKTLQSRVASGGEGLSYAVRLRLYLPPLEEPASAVEDYIRAGEAADSFLSLADQNGSQDARLETALYLGGIAKYTLGYKEKALQSLTRLRREFPKFSWGDGTSGSEWLLRDTGFAEATAPAVTKLILFLKLQQVLAVKPSLAVKDALPLLQDMTQIASAALGAQKEYKTWLIADSTPYNPREFDEGRYGPMPDQRRASALPPLNALIDRMFDALMEPAVRGAGVRAVRNYLRELTAPKAKSTLLTSAALTSATQTNDAPTSDSQASDLQRDTLQSSINNSSVLAQETADESTFANVHLARLDETILDGFRKRAAQLVAQNNFHGARGVWKEVMKEYANTPVASLAQAEIQNLTARSTQQLRAEGDKRFNPARQINVPQSQARAYFEKMFKEDPEGPQADYALLQWALALGTEGKLLPAIELLQSLPEKFPGSEFEGPAKYNAGFLLGHASLRRYPDAIACLEQVAEQYPESLEAPEALWHAAYFCYLHRQGAAGEKYLSQLEQLYKDSPRSTHIKDMRELLQKAS